MGRLQQREIRQALRLRLVSNESLAFGLYEGKRQVWIFPIAFDTFARLRRSAFRPALGGKSGRNFSPT